MDNISLKNRNVYIWRKVAEASLPQFDPYATILNIDVPVGVEHKLSITLNQPDTAYIFAWERSIDNGATWALIQRGEEEDPSKLSVVSYTAQTIWYRCKVTTPTPNSNFTYSNITSINWSVPSSEETE